MLSRLKKAKSSDEGFTLVELIVVLVILAILAALLIPALTGYIDKAREKQIIAETRQVVQAAQTLYDEEYAKAFTTIVLDEIEVLELAEVGGTIVEMKFEDGRVADLTYQSNGKTCRYVAEPDTADDRLDNDEYYNIIVP